MRFFGRSFIFARPSATRLSYPYPALATLAPPSPPPTALHRVSTRFVLAFYEYRFCVTGALVRPKCVRRLACAGGGQRRSGGLSARTRGS